MTTIATTSASTAEIQQAIGAGNTSTSSPDTAVPAPASTPAASTTAAATDSSSSTVGNLNLSSELLGLLQGTDGTTTSSGIPTIASLFAASTDDSDNESDLFTNVLLQQQSSLNNLASTFATGQSQTTASTTQTDPLQAVLTAYNSASNAASTSALQDIANNVATITGTTSVTA
jgi:hypothetical protein